MGINWNALEKFFEENAPNFNQKLSLSNKAIFDYICNYDEEDDNLRNEFRRLSWLGDAVIQFSISKWLYNNLNNKPNEEILTRIREKIVGNEPLVKWAKKKNLYKLLFDDEVTDEEYEELLSDFEDNTILANIAEAFFGACSLALNENDLQNLIAELFKIELHSLKEEYQEHPERLKDPKSLLLELENKGILKIKEKTYEKVGKRWRTKWTIEIENKEITERAIGKSKDIADQRVAERILERLKKEFNITV
ncbi:MAG: ribonuclease III domain-containing protein [Promethearchaeota archaeon]